MNFTLKSKNFGGTDLVETEVRDLAIFSGPLRAQSRALLTALCAAHNAAAQDPVTAALHETLGPVVQLSQHGQDPAVAEALEPMWEETLPHHAAVAEAAKRCKARLEGTGDGPVQEIALQQLELLIRENGGEFRARGRAALMKKSLILHFQTNDLRDLMGNPGEPASLEMGPFGTITLEGKAMRLDGGEKALAAPTLFLGQAAWWQLENALNQERRFHYGEQPLKRIPFSHELTRAILRGECTGSMAFPGIHTQIQTMIGGKITEGMSGLQFAEAGRPARELHTLPPGAVQLGILGFLIEKKALLPGAALFLEEPEAGLGAFEKTFLADSLFAMAKGGVAVRCFTRSETMLTAWQRRAGKRMSFCTTGPPAAHTVAQMKLHEATQVR